MNKLNIRILPKVSLIAFITGLVIIINSTGWGSDAATAFIGSHNGMGTTQFSTILQASINSFSMIGGVLFFIGGVGCLISIIFFEMQKQ